jgi:phosphoribosylglycinamide formyltransferase 1
MKNIIILTSDFLRHTYLRKSIALNNNIKVIKSYCEVKSREIYKNIEKNNNDKSQLLHIELRGQSEKDFFQPFVDLTPDYSNPVYINKGDINSDSYVEEIIKLNPDFILAYGCSIIKPPLIKHFKNKFLNVHLGLSPYYRGSGTNFFPFVNNEPEYVGATFMYIDEGIDTGDIIHQVRAEIHYGDSIHQIGNRLISKVAYTYIDIINNFDKLNNIKQPNNKKDGLYFKSSDFTPKSVEIMYENFENGLVSRYIKIPETDKCRLYQNKILNKG